MKKKTVEYLKEVDLEGIINKVCLYCNTIEEDLPDDIQNIFRKAQDLLDDPEAREYSISELQNIRGFIEKARQLTSKQDRLLKFHEMIEFSVGELDEGELAFRGKSLLMYFGTGKLLGSSISPATLDSRCSSFIDDFRLEYTSYHNTWHSQRRKVGRKYQNLKKRARTLSDLNNIKGLGDPIAEEIVQEISDFPDKLPECKDISSAELGYLSQCPHCGLEYLQGLNWQRFFELESEISMALPGKLESLSVQITNKIIERDPDDPLKAFIDTIGVADLDMLCNVLTPSLIDMIKKILAKD